MGHNYSLIREFTLVEIGHAFILQPIRYRVHGRGRNTHVCF